MTSFVNSLPCQKRTNIQAPRVLRLLEEKYIFVKKKTRSEIPLLTTTPFPRRRTTRVADASNIPGTTYCPWVWEQDDDPERVPRILVKAKCPGCKHFCKPVHYHHTVLIAKCDKTTGHKVWKWRERKLAVAYVYEPYDWREFLVAVWIVLLPKLLDYCNFIWKVYFYGIFIIYFEKPRKRLKLNQSANSFHKNKEKNNLRCCVNISPGGTCCVFNHWASSAPSLSQQMF